MIGISIVGDGVLDVPPENTPLFFGSLTELPLRGRVVEGADPYISLIIFRKPVDFSNIRC